jgi:thymidylate synthase (FAD)
MNKNNVELLGFYGSDEVVAQSAWTSTSRDITDVKRERIPNLLEMLWSNHHETPFEKVTVHFLVDTDIASHIHLLKHRMANINGESARYKELKEDKFYLPEDWKDINSKEKLYITVDPFNGEGTYDRNWYKVLESYTELGNQLYHKCLEDLTPVLGRKRAKESARFFKTYNSQIQADVTFNMRSFANFIKLRNSEHAQLEIREVAQQMWNLVQNETEGKFDNVLKVIDDRIKFEEKCEKYKDLIMKME